MVQQLDDGGANELGQRITQALADLESAYFGSSHTSALEQQCAQTALEQLLDQGAEALRPAQTQLVFAGYYQQQYVGCGRWQYVPVYHQVQALAPTPPTVPDPPPPQLLPALPNVHISGNYPIFGQIYEASPETPSGAHGGEYATGLDYQIHPRTSDHLGGWVLEFEVMRAGVLQTVRYEVGSNGRLLFHPTVRPSGQDYPDGATLYFPGGSGDLSDGLRFLTHLEGMLHAIQDSMTPPPAH